MGRSPLLAALIVLPGVPAAQAGPLKADIVGSYDSLSGSFEDWRTLQVSLAKPLGPRRSLYGVGVVTERFGRTDQQLTLGAYIPVRQRLTSLVEVSYSPTHEILSTFAGTAQLQWELGEGWVATGGINHTEFRTDSGTGFIVGGEKYWSRYRAAYFLSGGNARHAGFAAGHRISLNEYLDDRTSLGLAVSFGQEVESVGVRRVLRTNVRGVSFGGRLGVSRRDSISAEVGYFEQGRIYVRRSLSLGYRHEF